MTNITLIGYRGTGKTAIGKLLAVKLKRRFTETDKLIEKKAGMNIKKIVEKRGWKRFRDLESSVVRELGNCRNCVIATGGGVVLRKKNVDRLKKNGVLILLKTDVKTIIKRIRNTSRPSLTGKGAAEEAKEVLQKRKKRYEQAADYHVNTKNVRSAVNKIINYLKKLGVV